jgi:ABC-2 type transport system ATP-binding protein
MPNDSAVVVRDLVKSYGSRRAIDGVSFDIARGELFALLGPNGAGKTTTVEILEGFRGADGGTVSVLGLDPLRDAAALKPRIGAMLQEGGLYPAITPIEALRLFAGFYAHPRSPEELLELTGLQESRRTRYRRLSGGQKQRLSLALALVGSPEMLFLDEPTAGLDPHARRRTWEIIADLRASGVTILLTTHYIEEAERLANQVAIIRDGRLIALGSPGALMPDTRESVRLHTTSPVPAGSLDRLPAVAVVREMSPCTYEIDARDIPSCLAEVTAWLRDQRIGVREIRVGRGSLEDVYLELTGEEGAA